MALSLGFAPGARNEPAGLALWYAHFFALASHRSPGRYFLDDEGDASWPSEFTKTRSDQPAEAADCDAAAIARDCPALTGYSTNRLTRWQI
jgi:hypothetical protein